MNTVTLLKNTLNAFQKSQELPAFAKHIQEVESSTIKLKEELSLLLQNEEQFSETIGIISSVLANVENEVKHILQKHKEIELNILTENFVAPIMAYLQKEIPHQTRVHINYLDKDTEVQFEILDPKGTKTFTLVPDFTEERVLFVANEELCNLSPFGSLTNAFGHELLVAPAELGTLIRLLGLK